MRKLKSIHLTVSLQKAIKWMSFLLVFMILMIGLFCAALATGIYVAHKTGKLQQWVSERLGVHVNFDVASLGFSNWEPTLSLQDIVIIPNNDQQAGFQVNKVTVKFALWQSLCQRTLVTERVVLSGASVVLTEQPDGQYRLAGFGSNKSGAVVSWQSFWQWMATQSSITLQQIHLEVQQINDRIEIDSISVEWNQVGEYHFSLQMNALLPQTINGSLQVLGDLYDEQGQPRAELYTSIHGKDLAYLLSEVQWDHLAVQHIGGTIQAWMAWQKNQLQSASAEVTLHQVTIANLQFNRAIDFPNMRLKFKWRPLTAGAWQVAGEPLYDEDNPLVLQQPPEYWQVTMLPQNALTQWQIQTSSINLELAADMALLLGNPNDATVQTLAHIQPQGYIKQAYVALEFQNQQLGNYVLDGDLDNLATQAFDAYPAVSGLSGHVHATQQWGVLNVQTNHFILGSPTFFAQTWPESILSTSILWQKIDTGWQLHLRRFYFNNPWLSVYLQGSSVIERTFTAPSVQFVGGVQIRQAQQALPVFLPLAPIVADHAREWLLSNLVAVPLATGSFVLKGSLNHLPFVDHQGVMQTVLNIPNATLYPWDKWPAIKQVQGRVLFNDQQLMITANQGVVAGGRVDQFSLTQPDLQKGIDSVMMIKGQVTADGVGIEPYIRQSPLADSVGKMFDALTIHGAVGVTVDMRFPVGPGTKNTPNQINGKVVLNNNTVSLTNTPIEATKVKGVVQFTPATLRAKDVKGSLFGHPLRIAIVTKTVKGIVQRQVTLKGTLDVPVIAKLFKLSLGSLVVGQAPFSTQIILSDNQVLAQLNSTLQGVQVNLPVPLTKAAESLQPLALSADFSDPLKIPVMGHIGQLLAARVSIAVNNHQVKGVVGVVTLGADQVSMPPKPPVHLFVNGSVASIAVSDWINAFKPLMSNVGYQSSAEFNNVTLAQWLDSAILNVGVLNFFSQQFDHVVAMVVWQSPSWVLHVAGPKASGSVMLPSNWNKPLYKGQFDYLFFERKANSRVTKAISLKDLLAWPSLDMNVKQLYWGADNFGAVQLVTQPVTKGIQVSIFKVNSPDFTSTIQGTLVALPKTGSFNVSGKVDAKNWGKTLTEVGYPNVISSGEGMVTFSGSWQGKLTAPQVSTIQGNVAFDLANGALSSVNPGMSRYLGILSVGSIFQRLSLNFSDLTEKGLAFDTLKGQYAIQKGVAVTQQTELTGPALNLTLSGSVDLVHKTLDQNVVVMPQIGGGLALAVGIIGGPIIGPIAGAATWLVDKVVTNTILKNKGLVYHVTGPWNNPTAVSAMSGGTTS